MCVTGGNQKANDQNDRQADQEGSNRSVQVDPDVHGRQKGKGRQQQHSTWDHHQGMEHAHSQGRDLHPTMSTDYW